MDVVKINPLDLTLFCWYSNCVAKRGRPKKQNPLDEYVELRLSSDEKQGFRDAADLAGIPLATWVRERLRQIAARELKKSQRPIAFLK